jgi:type I restriction enzyme M protein
MSSELDYAEQTSWVLFLKYLDDLESERADRAALEGKDYTATLEEGYRWADWAAPKDADGGFDHDAAMTGDDLIAFVDDELFPYLSDFKSADAATLAYKIGEVFTEIRSKFRSGYSLRDVLDEVDPLSFGTQAQRHELSSLYEDRIKRMGNAGRNGGEYYTPRPLIRAMIEVLQPRIGETVYDGAAGSAGFLCEAYEAMEKQARTAADREKLQNETFYGQEKKSLAYIIGVMNMILHGVEAPNIRHTNTLTENVLDYGPGDQHDVILANPPFGGGERKEVQHNFPIRSSETAYLFTQHFIRKLKGGGRAGVVIKNTVLSNTDNASVALRRELLEECNLHTILDLPGGTFQGAGVKTVVLFFERGEATRRIWYYQLDPGRKLGKTSPLTDDDLAEFVRLQKDRADSEKSWSVDVGELDQDTLDLSVRNPNAPEAAPLRSPEEIIDAMLARNAETAAILKDIRGML